MKISKTGLLKAMCRQMQTVLLSSIVLALIGLGRGLSTQAAPTPAFELKNISTQNTEEGEAEFIVLTGGGTFDPVSGAINAQGTFAVHNAFDEVPSGTMAGRWEATDLISFSSVRGKQILRIHVTLIFDLGFSIPRIEFILLGSAALVPSLAEEQFIIPLSGHTVFSMSGTAP